MNLNLIALRSKESKMFYHYVDNKYEITVRTSLYPQTLLTIPYFNIDVITYDLYGMKSFDLDKYLSQIKQEIKYYKGNDMIEKNIINKKVLKDIENFLKEWLENKRIGFEKFITERTRMNQNVIKIISTLYYEDEKELLGRTVTMDWWDYLPQ